MSSNYEARHPTQAVTKEQILEYLKKHPKSTRHQMAKDLSCNADTAKARLESMLADGEVICEPSGRTVIWTLVGYQPYVGEIVKPRTWEFKPMTSYRCANPNVDPARLINKFGSGLR